MQKTLTHEKWYKHESSKEIKIACDEYYYNEVEKVNIKNTHMTTWDADNAVNIYI